jgi:hypothetical protein
MSRARFKSPPSSKPDFSRFAKSVPLTDQDDSSKEVKAVSMVCTPRRRSSTAFAEQRVLGVPKALGEIEIGRAHGHATPVVATAA